MCSYTRQNIVKAEKKYSQVRNCDMVSFHSNQSLAKHEHKHSLLHDFTLKKKKKNLFLRQ